ncbi:MAG: T9SS type A sorting domain-containing protein, partial [Candidatus Cloacimonetes bacterium]|nr:T9SS type A sorting domain-containing protein [Candidatus Cloacimonadota bacterium]MDY0230001.1 FlgD immunoglobulin-like domain containing protein [Candidatus Cloacimonadaceae bacterium]
NGQVRGAQKLIAPEGFPAALLQIYTETANEEISLWLLRADGSEEKLANHFSSQPNSTLGSYPEFIILDSPTGNADENALATQLYGCYPNPFNPNTTISFRVAEENAMVSMNIYNLKGQKVRKLIRAEYPRGEHSLIWNGTDDSGRALSSGIYMIELNAGKYRKIVKALLSK